MKLTWHAKGCMVIYPVEADLHDDDLAEDDVVVVDWDTGIVYQGISVEGTGRLQKEVKEFLEA